MITTAGQPLLYFSPSLILFLPQERNCNLAFDELISISLRPSPSTLPLILSFCGDLMLGFFPCVHCGLVMWQLLASPPELLVSPDWIRGIFQRCPAVQNIAAHTNTFQSLDGPDTHSLAHTHLFRCLCIYYIYTHTKSPLTLTSLYTLCVMLCGLTELLSVWLFVFCTPVTQMVIPYFKTLSRSHWCSSKSNFICRKTLNQKLSTYRLMFQTSQNSDYKQMNLSYPTLCSLLSKWKSVKSPKKNH